MSQPIIHRFDTLSSSPGNVWCNLYVKRTFGNMHFFKASTKSLLETCTFLTNKVAFPEFFGWYAFAWLPFITLICNQQLRIYSWCEPIGWFQNPQEGKWMKWCLQMANMQLSLSQKQIRKSLPAVHIRSVCSHLFGGTLKTGVFFAAFRKWFILRYVYNYKILYIANGMQATACNTLPCKIAPNHPQPRVACMCPFGSRRC